MRSVTTNQLEQSDENDDNDEEPAINVIQNVALYSSNGEEMNLVNNKFKKLFNEDRIASKKQTNICDFFKPV